MEDVKQLEKQRLRALLKKKRSTLIPQERITRSVIICDKVRSQAWWREARTVHIYCAFGTEVQTGCLIQSAFAERKEVIVPLVSQVVSQASNLLEHYVITPQTCFEPDAFGIPSPVHDKTVVAITANEMRCDCVIVPLLGFDAVCNRIGYGKGYYDRFLSTLLSKTHTKPYLVGLAFQCQFVEQGIHAETHDIRLDAVITEHDVMQGASQRDFA
jgi:5-formyltetrahydrofolate cyclo-ligase